MNPCLQHVFMSTTAQAQEQDLLWHLLQVFKLKLVTHRPCMLAASYLFMSFCYFVVEQRADTVVIICVVQKLHYHIRHCPQNVKCLDIVLW